MGVAVYQIYYDDSQRTKLDEEFIPLYSKPYGDIITRERETAVIRHIYESGAYKSNTYTGCVSWKFKEKTRLSASQFLRHIDVHSDNDVYFASCGQRQYSNIWIQGEKYHPGIIELTQHILDNCNININIRELEHKRDMTSFCNFWVGSQKFWVKYFNFIQPVLEYIDNDLPDKYKKLLHIQADKKIKSNIFPFIYERILTTLLSIDSSIKYINIPRG